MPHVGTHTMCGLFVVADHYFFKAIGGSDKRITGEYLVCLFSIHWVKQNFLGFQSIFFKNSLRG